MSLSSSVRMRLLRTASTSLSSQNANNNLRRARCNNNISFLLLQPHCHHYYQYTPVASLSTAKKSKGKTKGGGKQKKDDDNDDDESSKTPHADAKAAAKERRRALFMRHEERKERLKTRRAHSGELHQERKKTFKEWFSPRRQLHENLEELARKEGKQWNYKVAVILERLPVVLPDRVEWEEDFEALRSYLESFGRIYPKELKLPPPEHEVALTDKPQTYEDVVAKLPFEPAPRETAADKSGEVATLDRRLKERVYLAVKDGGGGGESNNNSNNGWDFPTVSLKTEEKETFLQAAKRATAEFAGSSLEVYCPSNCPMAVDMVAYNGEQQDKSFFGEKIFYMRIQYDDGAVTEDETKAKEFAWFTREEMSKHVEETKGKDMGTFCQYLL